MNHEVDHESEGNFLWMYPSSKSLHLETPSSSFAFSPSLAPVRVVKELTRHYRKKFLIEWHTVAITTASAASERLCLNNAASSDNNNVSHGKKASFSGSEDASRADDGVVFSIEEPALVKAAFPEGVNDFHQRLKNAQIQKQRILDEEKERKREKKKMDQLEKERKRALDLQEKERRNEMEQILANEANNAQHQSHYRSKRGVRKPAEQKGKDVIKRGQKQKENTNSLLLYFKKSSRPSLSSSSSSSSPPSPSKLLFDQLSISPYPETRASPASSSPSPLPSTRSLKFADVDLISDHRVASPLSPNHHSQLQHGSYPSTSNRTPPTPLDPPAPLFQLGNNGENNHRQGKHRIIVDLVSPSSDLLIGNQSYSSPSFLLHSSLSFSDLPASSSASKWPSKFRKSARDGSFTSQELLTLTHPSPGVVDGNAATVDNSYHLQDDFRITPRQPLSSSSKTHTIAPQEPWPSSPLCCKCPVCEHNFSQSSIILHVDECLKQKQEEQDRLIAETLAKVGSPINGAKQVDGQEGDEFRPQKSSGRVSPTKRVH